MMSFYHIVLGYLVICFNHSFADESFDFFNIDDYESARPKWKNPHDDVFAYSEPGTADKLPESLGTTGINAQCDKLHAAVKACQTHTHSCNLKVKNTNIHVQRFIKHLVRIYDESMEYYEGIIHLKLDAEDKAILRSFADDGKFPSHTYNNIHDLLKKALNVPSKSIIDRIFPSVNFFVRLPKMLWNWITYFVQEAQFGLMQFVFSADVTIYASMILPPFTFFCALRRGNSVRTGVMLAAVAVGFISYFVELRSAIEVARAQDMARMTRSRNMPPECKPPHELGWYEWVGTWVPSFASGDKCEEYFRDQVPQSSIEPSGIFWNILFAPITVGMEKFGKGLGGFISTFGKNFNSVTMIFLLPIGVTALLWFLALLLSFVSGGSLTLPLVGRISFSNPFGHGYNPVISNAASEKPADNSASTTASTPAISNNFNFQFFHPSHPALSEKPSHLGLNMSIAGPSGPTLQLTSGPSGSNHNIEITGENSGTVKVQASQLTSGGPQTSDELCRTSEQPKTIASPESSQSSNPARTGVSDSRCLQLSTIATSSRANEESRAPLLVRGFSESDRLRNFDTTIVSNQCALKEIGAGDFIPRDIAHPMLPSGVIRWRHHHRKLSL